MPKPKPARATPVTTYMPHSSHPPGAEQKTRSTGPENSREADEFVLDLERRERDLNDFIENAAVALHWVDEDGTILWANKAELQLLGYARAEYVGHNIAEFHVDEACDRRDAEPPQEPRGAARGRGENALQGRNDPLRLDQFQRVPGGRALRSYALRHARSHRAKARRQKFSSVFRRLSNHPMTPSSARI